jgi:hypothetical protein
MYLFVSFHCPHSCNLIKSIQNHPIRGHLQLINIDDENTVIPEMIKVVPTLYIASSQKLYTNNDLQYWMKCILENTNIPDIKTNADLTGSNDLLPYISNEMIGGGGGGSTAYSFLDNNLNEQLEHNYNFIDNRESANGIPAFTKTSESSSTSSSSRDYDRVVQQRANDPAAITRRA